MKRSVIAVLLLSVLIVLFSPSAHAHSGGTDGNGGHVDHSTGKYHYHHGHHAHQHPNGVCPYEEREKTQKKNNTIVDIVLISLICFPIAVKIILYMIKQKKSGSSVKSSLPDHDGPQETPASSAESGGDESKPEIVYYYVKNGNRYHKDRNCGFLRNSKKVLACRENYTVVLCWRHPCPVCCRDDIDDFYSVIRQNNQR